MRLTTEGLFIKVSGVTTEEDALFSIGLGASAVGFEFALGPNQVTVTVVQDIVRRLPQGAVSVGVFRQELPQRVVEIANTIGLSAVQIDGPASADELLYISDRVNTVLRTVPAGTTRLALANGVDYLVLPEADEHEALVEALELIGRAGPRLPIIASGGLTCENVTDVVRRVGVFGVDARGGVERAPGVKDPVLLGEFIANARWAYEHSYVERHFDEWTP
jgi:phosphoribosylanthranilate isomerase